jgi:hypothetical protein
MTHDDAENIKRHFGVIAAGLRSEICLVARGHSSAFPMPSSKTA